jgi:hypothetical protein
MTIFPPTRRSKSGEHPDVAAFRDKLESIAEHTVPAADDLNQKLADYLQEVRTPVPPADEPKEPSERPEKPETD